MGGGGNNDAAIAEQKAARKQSADQFAVSTALQLKQMQAAANVKPVTINPTAAPQTTDQNTLDQRREVARQSNRRFSYQSTMGAAGTQTLGGATAFGGAKAT